MSLIITKKHLFVYDELDKPKKWEARAAIHEKHLLLKVDHDFSTTEESSSSKPVLSENTTKDAVLKYLL